MLEKLTGGQKPNVIVSSMHRWPTQSNWIHQMLSTMDIGDDSVSSLDLLIIVVDANHATFVTSSA